MEENRNKRKSCLATVALIMGIIALVTAFTPAITYVSVFFSVLATVFAVICLFFRVSKRKAVVALVLAILAVAVSLCLWIFFIHAIGEGIEAGFDDIGNGIRDVLDRFMSTMEKSGAPAEETIAVFTE